MNIQQIKAGQKLLKEKADRLNAEQLYAYSRTHDGRVLITDIYKRLFRAVPKGCDSCFYDALVRICATNIDRIMDRIKCDYALKAGVLLQDRHGDDTKMCTNRNVTNDLAEYHLATNPGVDILFTILPDDWEKRVEKRRKELGKPEAKKPEPPKVEDLPVVEGIDEAKELELIEAAQHEAVITDPETLSNTVEAPKKKGGRPKKIK
jgi:hypothetical protein